MCVPTVNFDRAVRDREAAEIVALDVLRDNKRKMTKSKEKAVKAGKGMSQGLKGLECDAILTAYGRLSIPLTDVHNHHPRQLIIIIIIIMTAMTTRRIRKAMMD